MKRVVLSLVGGGCLLVAVVAMSQTSVLVAQNTQGSQKQADGQKTRYDHICRDWPVYFDGTNVLFYCDAWFNFSGTSDCVNDPDAAYEFTSADKLYPCDCSATSGLYQCDDQRHDYTKFMGLKTKRPPANVDSSRVVVKHLNAKLGGAKDRITVDVYHIVVADKPKGFYVGFECDTPDPKAEKVDCMAIDSDPCFAWRGKYKNCPLLVLTAKP